MLCPEATGSVKTIACWRVRRRNARRPRLLLRRSHRESGPPQMGSWTDRYHGWDWERHGSIFDRWACFCGRCCLRGWQGFCFYSQWCLLEKLTHLVIAILWRRYYRHMIPISPPRIIRHPWTICAKSWLASPNSVPADYGSQLVSLESQNQCNLAFSDNCWSTICEASLLSCFLARWPLSYSC